MSARILSTCVLLAAVGTHGAAAQPFPASRKITIPTIDISGESARHVVIAEGTEETYHGHPTTLLLPDGKTMFYVWTYGHGGTCGPLKRSNDGGRTWSDLLPVPDNWRQVRNCPAIYRLVDPVGKPRLLVFAGQGPRGAVPRQAAAQLCGFRLRVSGIGAAAGWKPRGDYLYQVPAGTQEALGCQRTVEIGRVGRTGESANRSMRARRHGMAVLLVHSARSIKVELVSEESIRVQCRLLAAKCSSVFNQ